MSGSMEEEMNKLRTESEAQKKELEHMKKQIHQINNPSSGTKGATLPVWQQLFIKLVSPKLVHFNKPLLVAVISSIFTLGALALIMWGLSACVTQQDFKTGQAADQNGWVTSATAAGAEVCLKEMKTFTVGDQGSYVQEKRCMPLAGDVVDKEFNIEWCDGAKAVAKAKCDADHNGPTSCPGCVPASNPLAVFTSVVEVTTCPLAAHLVFWTLAQFWHVATLMTLIVVFVLMALGVLKQYDSSGKLIGLKKAAENDAKTDASLNA